MINKKKSWIYNYIAIKNTVCWTIPIILFEYYFKDNTVSLKKIYE